MMPDSLEVLSVLWRASWQAAALAMLVLLVSQFFKRAISPSALTVLWTLPILRLLLLIVPASNISIFNSTAWISSKSAKPLRVEKAEKDMLPSSGFPAFESHHQAQANAYTVTDTQPAQPETLAVNINTANEAAVAAAPQESVVTAQLGDKRTEVKATMADAVAILWWIGVMATAIRFPWAQFALRKIIATGNVVPIESIPQLGQGHEVQASRWRHVRLVVVEDKFGPAVTGILRPTILLPKQFMDSCSSHELKMAITHELEHIRRYDTLWLLLAQVALIVHWYNPLAYWLRKRLQEQAEIAVDAATLRKLGTGKVNEYAELLFKVASRNAAPAHLVAMARNSSSFRRRVEQLAVVQPITRLRTTSSVFVVLLFVFSGLSDAVSQQQETKATAAKSIVVVDSPIAKPLPDPTTAVQVVQANQQQAQKAEVRKAEAQKAEAPKSESTPTAPEDNAIAQAVEKPNAAQTQSVMGRVVDVDGKAVPNATLHCDCWLEKESRGAKMRAVTNELGEFTLTFPNVSELAVHEPLYTWVYAEGYGLRVVSMLRVSKDGGDKSDVTITLPALEKVPTSFQIVAPDGQPLAGALVCPSRVELPNGSFQTNEPEGMVSSIPEELWEALAVRTDEQGKAALDKFPKGLWYGLACKTEEFGLQRFEGREVTKGMRLQLSPVGTIRFKIDSEDRALFKDFGVYVETSKPHSQWSVNGVARGKFDENGELHVPIIAAGSISLMRVGTRNPTATPDRELVTTKPYSQSEVLPNATLEFAFQAPPTIKVTGIVLTSDTRQPVVGAEIHYSSARGLPHSRQPHSRRCVTNAQGEFEANVVPGMVDFDMTMLGKNITPPGRYDYPRIFPGEITKETTLEVLLPVSKSIKGRLQDAEGRPIANQKIARRRGKYRHICGIATTDETGSFEMYVHNNWPLTESYWVMVDKIDADQRNEIVVHQMSSSGDFYVLERPKVPASPPKSK